MVACRVSRGMFCGTDAYSAAYYTPNRWRLREEELVPASNPPHFSSPAKGYLLVVPAARGVASDIVAIEATVMRVLIIDAFAGSRVGRAAFRKFEAVVRDAFKKLERHEAGPTEYVIRHFIRGLEVIHARVPIITLIRQSTLAMDGTLTASRRLSLRDNGVRVPPLTVLPQCIVYVCMIRGKPTYS